MNKKTTRVSTNQVGLSIKLGENTKFSESVYRYASKAVTFWNQQAIFLERLPTLNPTLKMMMAIKSVLHKVKNRETFSLLYLLILKEQKIMSTIRKANI